MAVEVVLSVVADSLALLSDAAHMLVDAAALGMSVWAARLALRPAAGRMTFGFRRAEILAAQANGITLLVLGIAIVIEALRRLSDPPAVDGELVFVTAAVGAGVNVLALWQVAHANRENLNVEGSYRHLLTDLYAFAGTALAGLVVWTTGFDRADPIASLLVAGSMLFAAWPPPPASGPVLLQGAPEGLSPGDNAPAPRGPARGRDGAAPARERPDPPRGSAGRAVAGRHRDRTPRPRRRRERARPARLGDQLGLHGALRTRARRPRRGLPPHPPRARVGAPRAVRDRAYDAPGGPHRAAAALAEPLVDVRPEGPLG